MYLPRLCVKETIENIQHPQNISCLCLFAWFTQIWFNPRTYTQIHDMLHWNDFTFSGKPFILGVTALVEAFEVTNNGRHLGFY